MWPEEQEEKHGTFEEKFPTPVQKIFCGSSKKVDEGEEDAEMRDDHNAAVNV